jgi:uncharacterized repeat protein (TIGR03803 family)
VFYGATQKFHCEHIFSSASGYSALYTLVGATDGCHITSRLFKKGSSLYGVTEGGGAFGCGTLFQFGLPSGPYTARYHFQCGPADGEGPTGDIAFYSGKFYGPNSAAELVAAVRAVALYLRSIHQPGLRPFSTR